MALNRLWTEEEDKLLKYVFETSNLTKWSHIARKLFEDYGIKNRNGKHCKERYITSIDTNHPREQWSYEDEQRMFDLHNQLGNKWAIIGQKLSGRTDNCVKNHFYSRLRKALRKLNQVITTALKKQMKQLKPNVLYRIVEASEEKFKIFPSFDKVFSASASILKNELLEFSYDDDINENQQSLEENQDLAKELIFKIVQFTKNYKKKSKKEKKGQMKGLDLLTPHRYEAKKSLSQNEESDGSSLIHSSQTSNIEQLSDDESSRVKKKRRGSYNDSETLPMKLRTRALSQGFLKENEMEIESEHIRESEDHHQHHQELEIEHQLDGLKILEEDDLPPLISMMKSSSKCSRQSYNNNNELMEEEFSFFEDSEIGVRIFPVECMGAKKDSHIEERLFH